MSETADQRLMLWQCMGGSARWGIGVAVDIKAIEARLAALESSRPVHIAQETAGEGANNPGRESSSPTSDGPGRGYRWVEVGETLESGDEDCIGGFRGADSVGERCQAAREFRRRITPAEPAPDDAGRRLVNGVVGTTTAASDGPGDGYRWVRENEVILASDEGEREAGVWGRVRYVMGQVCDEPCTYRRRITPATNEASDGPRLTDEQREAILFCVSCAQDYRAGIETCDDQGRGQWDRATRMIQAAADLAIPAAWR